MSDDKDNRRLYTYPVPCPKPRDYVDYKPFDASDHRKSFDVLDSTYKVKRVISGWIYDGGANLLGDRGVYC
jgi:hypothetical protein